MFRIDRQLRPVDAPTPTAEWVREVVKKFVPEHLKERLELEHEIDFALGLEGVGRFRVNVFQQRGSFVLAMRVMRAAIRSFQELRLPAVMPRICESPRGIILIAGAPGSGKSTTLAAMIEHLNATTQKHVITLEDPIEFFFEDRQCIIEQREIGLDTANFATGLRNVLRQDPDVLVIGEMRDHESARAALSAANVGTLVISTLHTNDAARSIQRILELFPAEEREHARRQIASTLRAVVCQRLVRTTDEQAVPAVEVMINTASVSKLIETNRMDQLGGAIDLGGGDGMQSFDQSLADLLRRGEIGEAEALAHAPNPDGFRMRLKGVVLQDVKRIIGAR